jgi:hypothetical protein
VTTAPADPAGLQQVVQARDPAAPALVMHLDAAFPPFDVAPPLHGSLRVAYEAVRARFQEAAAVFPPYLWRHSSPPPRLPAPFGRYSLSSCWPAFRVAYGSGMLPVLARAAPSPLWDALEALRCMLLLGDPGASDSPAPPALPPSVQPPATPDRVSARLRSATPGAGAGSSSASTGGGGSTPSSSLPSTSSSVAGVRWVVLPAAPLAPMSVPFVPFVRPGLGRGLRRSSSRSSSWQAALPPGAASLGSGAAGLGPFQLGLPMSTVVASFTRPDAALAIRSLLLTSGSSGGCDPRDSPAVFDAGTDSDTASTASEGTSESVDELPGLIDHGFASAAAGDDGADEGGVHGVDGGVCYEGEVANVLADSLTRVRGHASARDARWRFIPPVRGPARLRRYFGWEDTISSVATTATRDPGRRDMASLETIVRDFGMQDLSSLATTTRGLPTARFITDWHTEATGRIEAD